MDFACRICKDKFSVTKVLSDSAVVSEGFSVVSTQCGHLFHWKCLEGVLTNQKLLHARHGTGPLRRFCPVVGCNANIPSEDSIIKISFNDDGHTTSEDGEEAKCEDTEGKLVKRVQTLMVERDRLSDSLERVEAEAEVYRSAFERIKLDLADVRSFLKDDYHMRKGDLIFWITKDGTFAPGKILEIRKKPGENVHYAIVKLDCKTKVPGVGPYSVSRDTLILPVSDLVTFKSFFNGFFDKFQTAFDALRIDLNSEMQDISSPTGSYSSAERNAAYYRSARKISRTASKSSIGTSTLNPLDELDSETVESVPVISNKHSSIKPSTIQTSTKITRSKTIHYGAGNEPRRLEKCRSMSWVTPPTRSLDSPTTSESSSRFNESLLEGSTSNSQADFNDTEDDTSEFIKEGERVIWFDSYSEFQQIGTVAAVCEYTPCAIVKFDEHPIVKYKFQYRTVQLDDLFPYDLASPEEKFRIAESYGKVGDFVDHRKHLFSIANEEISSDCENDNENEDN